MYLKKSQAILPLKHKKCEETKIEKNYTHIHFMFKDMFDDLFKIVLCILLNSN